MKFKDKVVILFLSGVLIYAVCCRSNIIRNKLMVVPEKKETSMKFNWQDTIHFRNFEITADTVDGITIRKKDGEILSSLTSLKSEAIDLHQNQVLNGDTLQLLYCNLTNADTITCFCIMDDGSLMKINL